MRAGLSFIPVVQYQRAVPIRGIIAVHFVIIEIIRYVLHIPFPVLIAVIICLPGFTSLHRLTHGYQDQVTADLFLTLLDQFPQLLLFPFRQYIRIVKDSLLRGLMIATPFRRARHQLYRNYRHRHHQQYTHYDKPDTKKMNILPFGFLLYIILHLKRPPMLIKCSTG